MASVRSTLEVGVYQDLRERLVDRSRRNRLLHFRHGARAPIIRVIDEALDQVLGQLRDDGRSGSDPSLIWKVSLWMSARRRSGPP